MGLVDLTALFLIGLSGTAHCVGMCGPLVLALPARDGLRGQLLYHAGRLTTYTLLGAGLGSLGNGVQLMARAGGGDPLLWLSRMQIGLSGVGALVLLWLGLSRLGVLALPAWLRSASPAGVPGFGRGLGWLTRRAWPGRMLGVGLLLGLLPCGLTYAALARALPSGSPLAGGMLTLAFGLGTLPGLLLLGTGLQGLVRRHQRLFELLAGLLMVGLGASLLFDALRVLG